MNAPKDHDWRPDPQLLDAYFDGEMEGRDDGADLRTRVETWLEHHPEVRDQWVERLALGRLWIDTVPREPSEATWHRVLDRIETAGRPAASVAVRRYRRTLGAIAASIALLVGLGYSAVRYVSAPVINNLVVASGPLDDDEAIFPVATADEIVVTYIQGADTRAIAVGQLPVHGPLELAEIGDVHIVAIRSDASSRMLPQVRQDGPHRPMIWMPLESD